MGTYVKIRPHHQKFFDDLKVKAKAGNTEGPSLKEQAEYALCAADGNRQAAAKLLGWSRCKLRYHLGEAT